MKRSIGNKLPGIVALGVALAPGMANALGFGDLMLQSRIGEPLLAEVPITAGTSESPQTACFSLAPLPGADFPVVTAAKTKLIRRGPGYVLQIAGSQPLTEPIIAISLRASCGQDLQRDYVLMPDAPLSFADAGGTRLASAQPSRQHLRMRRSVTQRRRSVQIVRQPSQPNVQYKTAPPPRKQAPSAATTYPLPLHRCARPKSRPRHGSYRKLALKRQ